MTPASDTLFIIGSGFTKAAFPQAPLNADLLRAVVKHGGSTLARYHERYRTDDIERLLTQLDLDAIESIQNREDRVKINREISSYFSKFRFSELQQPAPGWLHTFALNVLKPNDAIITLNYDCFLEGALDNYEVWTPNGGYAGIVNPNANSIPVNPKNIMIYKIHGSEHFVESSVMGDNRTQTAIGFKIDGSIFPKSGPNRQLGGGAVDPRPYIIAPSFVKIPHVEIADIMLEALDQVETAKNLTIIGCGMRREDNFLWLLLTRFLNKSFAQRKQLVILGPSSTATWERISNYWVGNVQRFADVVVIPCGIECSIERLCSALDNMER